MWQNKHRISFCWSHTCIGSWQHLPSLKCTKAIVTWSLIWVTENDIWRLKTCKCKRTHWWSFCNGVLNPWVQQHLLSYLRASLREIQDSQVYLVAPMPKREEKKWGAKPLRWASDFYLSPFALPIQLNKPLIPRGKMQVAPLWVITVVYGEVWKAEKRISQVITHTSSHSPTSLPYSDKLAKAVIMTESSKHGALKNPQKHNSDNQKSTLNENTLCIKYLDSNFLMWQGAA